MDSSAGRCTDRMRPRCGGLHLEGLPSTLLAGECLLRVWWLTRGRCRRPLCDHGWQVCDLLRVKRAVPRQRPEQLLDVAAHQFCAWLQKRNARSRFAVCPLLSAPRLPSLSAPHLGIPSHGVCCSLCPTLRGSRLPPSPTHARGDAACRDCDSQGGLFYCLRALYATPEKPSSKME